MKTLRDCIHGARKEGRAVGHFNISNIEGVWAVFHAARSLDLPVIIGVSEGERDFVGIRQIGLVVQSIREEFDYPIFINADHTYSYDRVREAVDAGYDAVIFDGAKLSFGDNMREAKRCVEYARSRNPEILVEAELGYIGTSSKLLDELPEGAALAESELTTIDEAKEFIAETGVDLFSPAIGSVHGMLRLAKDPDLNIARIREIASAVDVPLVLHGASGLRDENVKDAIAAGISLVHINTELRVAFRDALRRSLADNLDEVAPYKFIKPAALAMQKVVEAKLKLFNGIS